MKEKINPCLIIILTLMALITYLFVSAPTPLPEEYENNAKKVSVKELFTIIAYENNAARTLYTKQIVGAGKKQGIAFNEHWKEKDIIAGPLPALFLRETAAQLKKCDVPLGLFLGSDFPIASANKLTDVQQNHFEEIRKTGEAKFFFDEDLYNYTAMFPDYAVDIACVNCHNQHEKSPKKDWKLGDIMGATTWSYPKDSIEMDELMKIIDAYRKSAKEVYSLFLSEVKTLERSPAIGNKWPAQGYFLPSQEVFVDSLSAKASPHTLQALLQLHQHDIQNIGNGVAGTISPSGVIAH